MPLVEGVTVGSSAPAQRVSLRDPLYTLGKIRWNSCRVQGASRSEKGHFPGSIRRLRHGNENTEAPPLQTRPGRSRAGRERQHGKTVRRTVRGISTP